MGRHAVAAGHEGREVRRRLQRERRRRHYPGGAWRYLTGGLAIAAASGYMESTSVPGYLHPVQAVFGVLLPLAVIDAFGTSTANFLGQRRGRVGPLRPRAAYSLLGLGWTLAAGACALLAWAAGAGTTEAGFGGDWIATGLIWAAVISACAAVMVIGRALPTAGAPGRPAWPNRGRAAQLQR
jgi:hypothetical protein